MYNYNYNPKSEKDFCYNANVIAHYNNIDDDNYYDYYQNTALLLAVQIDMAQSKDFETYIKKNIVKISHDELMLYLHNKTKQEINNG